MLWDKVFKMIDIFTTGGTIDKVYFDALSEYQIGPTALPDMLRENNVYIKHRVTQLMRKDSLEITKDDRTIIRKAVESSDADMVLVTHGTDTMVETGKILSDIKGKTIVLTGAMQPATLRNSDAEFNVEGTYVAMNGQIFDPLTTVKDRTAGRFVSSE